MKKSLHNHLTCKDKECKWHGEFSQETSLRECDCSVPKDSAFLLCKHFNMVPNPSLTELPFPALSPEEEESDYEKKHCPSCKLDFLGIGFDSKCPECETKFVAPSHEWEKIREEFIEKCFNADQDAFLSISGEKAKFIADWWLAKIKEVESNALAQGKREGYKISEELLNKDSHFREHGHSETQCCYECHNCR